MFTLFFYLTRPFDLSPSPCRIARKSLTLLFSYPTRYFISPKPLWDSEEAFYFPFVYPANHMIFFLPRRVLGKKPPHCSPAIQLAISSLSFVCAGYRGHKTDHHPAILWNHLLALENHARWRGDKPLSAGKRKKGN